MQKDRLMGSCAPLITADEFARTRDDHHRCELAAGRIVRMSLPGSRHGVVATRIAVLLSRFADAHDLGEVMTLGGFKLAANPDTVRGPDVAFVAAGRIPDAGVPDGFWPGSPDLAVEVRSPGDRPSDIRAKVRDYLELGVRLVWVVDPRRQNVVAYRPDAPPAVLRADDTLDAADVLTGFTCPVRSLFESGHRPAVDV